MNPSALFSFGNTFVLLGWILLVFLPNWKFTQAIVLNGVIFVLAAVYTFLILKDIGSFDPASFSTLQNVKALFTSDGAVAAGWMHYLAFDLFVGAYVIRKSRELGISRVIYTILLPFVFMFGPIGYLLFVIVKVSKTKTLHEIS